MDLIDDPRKVLDNALLTELYANCRMFLKAWDGFESLRRQPPANPISIPVSMDDPWVVTRKAWEFDMWGYAYSLVGSAKRLSRLLFETPGHKKLATAYGLPMSKALQDPILVDVRDKLEHAEKWLPEFSRTDPGKVISGWAVALNIGAEAPPNVSWFRWLDAPGYDLRIRTPEQELKVNLKEIAEAVKELNAKLPTVTGGAIFTGRPPIGAVPPTAPPEQKHEK